MLLAQQTPAGYAVFIYFLYTTLLPLYLLQEGYTVTEPKCLVHIQENIAPTCDSFTEIYIYLFKNLAVPRR